MGVSKGLMAVRTWAPRGHTPTLRVKLTRDHLAAMSGTTLDGRVVSPVRHVYSYDVLAVVGFLRVLLRKVPGKIVLIWNNCRAMLRISIPMRGFGMISSGWN